VSVLAESGGSIVGAALVKRRASGPLVDCLFVHPEHARQGWATALVARVVQGLRRCCEERLLSYALLANEASVRWHHRFGFVEVPDLGVAAHRLRYYDSEVERHRAPNDLPEADRARLAAAAEHWGEEVRRLEEMERQDFWSAHPRFD